MCDEILDPVDLTDSKEVIEQAEQRKNPKAKQAAAELTKMLGKKLQEPNLTQHEKDSFDFFETFFKNKNYL